jgi:hypothetical protein
MTKVTKLGVIMILIAGLGTLNAVVNVVKNEDKPAKGEWNFDLEQVWAIEAAGDDILSKVRGLCIDDEDNVYVLDKKHLKIFVFNPEGTFLFSFGKLGEGPGEFQRPRGLYLEGKHIIIEDINNRLTYYNQKGEFKKSFRFALEIMPRAFFDLSHYITVRTDIDMIKKTNTLEIYDLEAAKGDVIAEFAAEQVVVVAARVSGGRIMVVMDEQEITSSVVLTVNKRKLYYGMNDKYLIKKVNLDSKKEDLSFSIAGRKRKPVPLEFKMKQVKSIVLSGGRKMSPAMEKQLIEKIPEHFTYFAKIAVDEKGLIYVFEAEVSKEHGQGVDIFSPEGKYLYHGNIKLPAGLEKIRPFVLKQTHIYTFVEDEEGEGKLVKYKIKKPS